MLASGTGVAARIVILGTISFDAGRPGSLEVVGNSGEADCLGELEAKRGREQEAERMLCETAALLLCCLAASLTLLRRLSAATNAPFAPVVRLASASCALNSRALTGFCFGLTMVSLEVGLLGKGGGLEEHLGETVAASKEL